MNPPKEAFFKLARDMFVPSERQPCWVCGKFKSITQSHHLLPVSLQWRIGISIPINDHKWLCPNHHAAIHILIGNMISKSEDMSIPCKNVLEDLEQNEGEIEKTIELLNITKAYLSKDPSLKEQQVREWRARGDALYQHADELERYNAEHPYQGPKAA